MKYDFMIIGFGFGGYVVVICVVQLGLKIVIIECYVILGGICFNVGCIFFKVLFDFLEYYYNVVEKFVLYGIQLKDFKVDMLQMIKWKNEVVV